MSTLPGLTKCGLALIAAFCLSVGNCDLKHNVIFVPNVEHADMIILPATEISEPDWKNLERILNASDEIFYSIQNFECGVAQPPIGKLPLPKDFKCRTDKGEFQGFTTGVSRTFTRSTRVIGQGCQSRCLTQTARHRRHSRKSKDGSQDLVDAVKPILLKYQRQ